MRDIELPLHSERFLLRDFTMDDIDAIQKIAESPGFRFVLLDGADPDTGKKFIMKCINDAAGIDSASGLRRHYRLAVTVKDAGGKLAGYAGLFNIDYDRGDGEIGFFIDPRLQRNGYASEAVGSLVKAAWNQIGLNNVYATAREDNAASRKVLEKLGMRKED